jgi:hypothetical protein
VKTGTKTPVFCNNQPNHSPEVSFKYTRFLQNIPQKTLDLATLSKFSKPPQKKEET